MLLICLGLFSLLLGGSSGIEIRSTYFGPGFTPFGTDLGEDHANADAFDKSNLEDIFGQKAVKDAIPLNTNTTDYVDNQHIQFMLFTRQNPTIDNGTEIYPGYKEHLLHYGFDATAPTKIICHGFNSNYKIGPGGFLAPAYFQAENGPLNIILVNWASLAGVHSAEIPEKPFIPKGNPTRRWYHLFYFPPAKNTELVGNVTGSLIVFLVRDLGLSLDNVHLIGHSLGAHAMGFAGRFVREKFPAENVSRFTALDPARPCFEAWHIACLRGFYEPMRVSDAHFVDVIHTNAGRFGITKPVGDVDFYPNSGFKQPGCPGFWRIFSKAICAHERSITLMRDSILYPEEEFLSRQCQDWNAFSRGFCSPQRSVTAVMGEKCSPKTPPGLYFLKTTANEPFLSV